MFKIFKGLENVNYKKFFQMIRNKADTKQIKFGRRFQCRKFIFILRLFHTYKFRWRRCCMLLHVTLLTYLMIDLRNVWKVRGLYKLCLVPFWNYPEMGGSTLNQIRPGFTQVEAPVQCGGGGPLPPWNESSGVWSLRNLWNATLPQVIFNAFLTT